MSALGDTFSVSDVKTFSVALCILRSNSQNNLGVCLQLLKVKIFNLSTPKVVLILLQIYERKPSISILFVVRIYLREKSTSLRGAATAK